MLEALWIVAREKCPTGAIGAAMSDRDIAEEMYWDEDPVALVDALVSTGWLDRDPVHRLVIHHWSQHVDDSVHRKVARLRALFADGTVPKLARLPQRERREADAFYANAHPHAPRAHDEAQGADEVASGAHANGSGAQQDGSSAHAVGSDAHPVGSGAHVVRTTCATNAQHGALPEPEPVITEGSSEPSGGEPPSGSPPEIDPEREIQARFAEKALTAEMPGSPPGKGAEPFVRIAWTLRRAHGALPNWSPPVRADVTRLLPADSVVRTLIDLFGEVESAAMFVFAHGDWSGGRRPTWAAVLNQRDQIREKMRGYEPPGAAGTEPMKTSEPETPKLVRQNGVIVAQPVATPEPERRAA